MPIGPYAQRAVGRLMRQDTPGDIVIMVIEDHPATLAALMKLFDASFPGCALLGAESAEQALALCAGAAPHVVVMDIALPGMNGIQATSQIKARFPETLVVMHSSYDMPIYREASAAAGACAFIGKAKIASDLVTAVSRLLPGAAAQRSRDFPTE